MTNKELAEILEINPHTLKKYIKLGLDKAAGVEACKQWIIEHAAMSGKGGSLTVGTKTFTAEDIINIKANYYISLDEKTKTQAELNKVKLQIEKGELLPKSELEKALNNILKPLRQALDNMPYKVSGRCNPTQPLLAQEVLESELQDIYKSLTDNINANS